MTKINQNQNAGKIKSSANAGKKMIADNAIKLESPASLSNEIKSLNLSSLKSQLEGLELKERKEKSNLYNYPEGFDKKMINSDEGKKFRNRLRNQIKSLCNNILYYAKGDQKEKLIAEIEKFNSFYKINYSNNDYSLSSISNSRDADKEKDFSLMMQIIKLSL